MDPKFQTAFVPRRPMMPGSMAAAPKKAHFNIFGIIATVIFIVTILLSVGSFIYERTLLESNTAKREQIQAEIASFDKGLIEELSLLKARIDTAVAILKNHIALSQFFTLLQEKTVSTVEFSSFEYRGTVGEKFEIELQGRSPSFNDLVLQSDTFLADSQLRDVLFSNFNVTQSGDVEFVVTASIDPSVISYKKVVEALSLVNPTSASATPALLGDEALSASPNTPESSTSTATPTSTPSTP